MSLLTTYFFLILSQMESIIQPTLIVGAAAMFLHFVPMAMDKVDADVLEKKSVEPNTVSKPNNKLDTASGVTFADREIGAKWNTRNLGIGSVMGLSGKKLVNTSHSDVNLNNFLNTPSVERTAVANFKIPTGRKVLPPGPVDLTVDFMDGPEISNSKSGKLGSWDLRDLLNNDYRKHMYWVPHGGVSHPKTLLQYPKPPYGMEHIEYDPLPVIQQYPQKISNTSAQGFFA